VKTKCGILEVDPEVWIAVRQSIRLLVSPPPDSLRKQIGFKVKSAGAESVK